MRLETILKCLRLRHCQGTVIKTHYDSHNAATTGKTVLQVSKQ